MFIVNIGTFTHIPSKNDLTPTAICEIEYELLSYSITMIILDKNQKCVTHHPTTTWKVKKLNAIIVSSPKRDASWEYTFSNKTINQLQTLFHLDNLLLFSYWKYLNWQWWGVWWFYIPVFTIKKFFVANKVSTLLIFGLSG